LVRLVTSSSRLWLAVSASWFRQFVSSAPTTCFFCYLVPLSKKRKRKKRTIVDAVFHYNSKKLLLPVLLLVLYTFIIARRCCSYAFVVTMCSFFNSSGSVLVLRCLMLFDGTNHYDWIPQMCLHMRGI
jgi:hypothetical protein